MKQFYFKQFSLASVICLHSVKTSKYTVKILSSSIWPINRAVSSANLQARVDLGVMVMKGYSAFPKIPALLEPHHQIV